MTSNSSSNSLKQEVNENKYNSPAFNHQPVYSNDKNNYVSSIILYNIVAYMQLQCHNWQLWIIIYELLFTV